MIPRHIRKRLPKANLISIEFGGYHRNPYWAKFRGANFIRWQLWSVCIQHRAPWDEGLARMLHPHLFT
jgi:hypothetical protein